MKLVALSLYGECYFIKKRLRKIILSLFQSILVPFSKRKKKNLKTKQVQTGMKPNLCECFREKCAKLKLYSILEYLVQ